MKRLTREVVCPYCNKRAQLVSGSDVYPKRQDLKHQSFWACLPCGAWVGCHKEVTGNIPLGTLANADLRKARIDAHAAFDPIWRDGHKRRKRAYSWLSKQIKVNPDDCHIGSMNLEQCEQVVRVCIRYFNQQREKGRAA